jgi:N-acetyl-anhydromuramyl-L-alanine amidase AmpD
MKSLSADALKYLVVHGAFTPPSFDIGAEEIREWHLQKEWDDIGYHYVIRRDGKLERGRSLEYQGAHVLGHNHESIGICLVGGASIDGTEWEFNYTRPQLVRLEVVARVFTPPSRPLIVTGHLNLDANRQCPGFNVGEWWYGGSPD